jgi:hypothetical protein
MTALALALASLWRIANVGNYELLVVMFRENLAAI